MREHEARLGAALSIAQLGMFEWNLKTNAVTLDYRCREIIGFTQGQGTCAQEVFERIEPRDLPRVQAEARATQGDLSRLETLYRIRLPDGRERVDVSISHTAPDGPRMQMGKLSAFSGSLETSRRAASLRIPSGGPRSAKTFCSTFPTASDR